jgi:hypothetical protein
MDAPALGVRNTTRVCKIDKLVELPDTYRGEHTNARDRHVQVLHILLRIAHKLFTDSLGGVWNSIRAGRPTIVCTFFDDFAGRWNDLPMRNRCHAPVSQGLAFDRLAEVRLARR